MKYRNDTTEYGICAKKIKFFAQALGLSVPSGFVLWFLAVACVFCCLSSCVEAQGELPQLSVPQSLANVTEKSSSLVLPKTPVPSAPPAVDTTTVARCEFYPRSLAEKLNRIIRGKSEDTQLERDYGASILQNIDLAVYHLDRGEMDAADGVLDTLVQDIQRWAELRTTAAASGWSAAFLEEVQLDLERRVILWRLAAQAGRCEIRPLTAHYIKDVSELQRLKEKTMTVEEYFLDTSKKTRSKASKSASEIDQAGDQWRDYLDTKTFIVEMEACERSIQGPNKQASAQVSRIPLPMLVAFCERANVILARLDDPGLSDLQKAYLAAPAIRDWQEELRHWTADTVSPSALLRAMERFEATAGMSDMQTLFRLAIRQSFSPTPEFRQLGTLAKNLYGLPNVKLYVSKALINNHLPPMKPESAPFRETIQGQPTRGHRQSESDLEIRFLPDESRLRLSLDVDVNIETNSRSSAFATTLFNSGQAKVEANKEIELAESGFLLAPSQVRVTHNRLHLRRFQTDFDRVPLLSNLARRVVKSQYETKIGGARNETQQKIARQVRDRLDREAENRFDTINERYRQLLDNSMERFELVIEQKDAKTEEEWLLASWAIRSQDSLSGNTPAPETPAGSFADLKIHESVINTIVGKMEFDGKSGTVAEIRAELAEKFGRPELDVPGDNDDVPITFADYNPIVVRFVDGKAEIAISLKSLRIQGKTHRDFKVLVRYEADVDSDGKLVLKRNGVISLIGCPRIGDQIAIRAAFGMIFPEKRLVPLTPKVLETNSDFQYLTTDHCRIGKGWFAVALVAKDDPNGLRQANSAERHRR